MAQKFDHSDRSLLFVDSSHAIETAKVVGFDIDYVNLLDYVESESNLIRAYHYDSKPLEDDAKKIRFLDFLAFNGFTVQTSPSRRFFSENGKDINHPTYQVQMAIDMFELAENVDSIYVFTCDPSLTPAIEYMKRRGVRVMLISTDAHQEASRGHHVSMMKRVCDEFIDIAELKPEVSKKDTN